MKSETVSPVSLFIETFTKVSPVSLIVKQFHRFQSTPETNETLAAVSQRLRNLSEGFAGFVEGLETATVVSPVLSPPVTPADPGFQVAQ